MSANKTAPTKASVTAFLKSQSSEQRQKECFELLALMKEVTGEKPIMWGDSMVGFGNYHYKYDSGREGDWFLTGFSPRKQNLTVYIMSGFENYSELLTKLGRNKTSVSCLYLKDLESIDMKVLKKLIKLSYMNMKKSYPTKK